jgi:dihydroxyacetone kinase-like protein
VTDVEPVLRAAANALIAHADELNRLDAQAGDGDLGVTMTTAARAALDILDGPPGRAVGDLLRTSGAAIAQKAPSTSGTLLATGLLRAARAIGSDGSIEGSVALAAALEAATVGIAERGKADIGSKTMLDSLAPASEAANQTAKAGGSLADCLTAAAEAARAGAAATASMRAVHGRAGWLADRSAGHEDAGARMVAILFDAAARAVRPADASA